MNEEKCIKLYCLNDKWSDLTPIYFKKQNNFPFKIRYSEKYFDLMNFFRSLLENEEFSERGLNLVNELIEISSINYVAWWYRRKTLIFLNFSLNDEILFLNKLLLKKIKCYQIWYHRKWLISKTNLIKDEISFLIEILKLDTRNFHAWSYLIWLSKGFNLFNEVFNVTTLFINLDNFNGSAFNCRKEIIMNSNNLLITEIEFLFEILKKNCNNHSLLSYLYYLSTLNEENFNIIKNFFLKNLNNNLIIPKYLNLMINK